MKRDGLFRFQGSSALGDERRHVQCFLEAVILSSDVSKGYLGSGLRLMEDRREIESTRLPVIDRLTEIEPIDPADELFEASKAHSRQVLPHFLGNETEEVLDELGFAGKLLPEDRILRGDADRTGVEVADPHQDATHHHRGEPFVAFDRDLPIRKAIDKVMRKLGVRLDIVMEFDNVESIKKAVSNGVGVSILPGTTVENEVAMKTLCSLPLDETVPRPIALIHRRNKALSGAATEFIAMLQDSYRA